jgi:hypothetical protein
MLNAMIYSSGTFPFNKHDNMYITIVKTEIIIKISIDFLIILLLHIFSKILEPDFEDIFESSDNIVQSITNKEIDDNITFYSAIAK